MFESSVNSEGIETIFEGDNISIMFESSVNSEGIETFSAAACFNPGLRAV